MAATSIILACTSVLLLIVPSLQHSFFRSEDADFMDALEFVKRQGGLSENAMSQMLEKLDTSSNLRKQLLARKFWK